MWQRLFEEIGRTAAAWFGLLVGMAIGVAIVLILLVVLGCTVVRLPPTECELSWIQAETGRRCLIDMEYLLDCSRIEPDPDVRRCFIFRLGECGPWEVRVSDAGPE